MLRQTNEISYYNTRLLRRDCSAHYAGATHEYLAVEATARRLTGLWFFDHARGSSRKDKFSRDIGLLMDDLQRDPANPRTMFYLAQTYMDAGRHDEASAWYERRIAVGGWEEEIWYSMYRIAQCHAR